MLDGICQLGACFGGLQYLELAHNRLGAGGINDLGRGLAANKTLLSINLSYNNISEGPSSKSLYWHQ